MTTETTPTPAQPPEPARDAEESETAFIVNVIVGLVGILAMGFAFAMAGDTGEVLPDGAEKKLPWSTIVACAGIFLFVLACGLEFPRLKKLIWQRRSATLLNVVLMSLLAVALTVIVNYVAARHYTEFDWTRQGVYSITDESQQVAKNLTKPVRITVIWPQQVQGLDLVQRLLDHYRAKSTRIELETLDPMTAREQFERKVTELGLENRDFSAVLGVVVQAGYYEGGQFKSEKSKHLTPDEFFEGGAMDPMSGRRGARKFKGEQALTNALMEVTQATRPKIYFVTGHDELDSEGQDTGARGVRQCGTFTRVLRSRNMDVATLALRETRTVPSDASVLVIAGPRMKYTDAEVATLEGWLKDGGKLIALLPTMLKRDQDSRTATWLENGLEGLLRRYNVELKSVGLVSYEPLGGGLARPSETSVATVFDSSHKITAPLANRRAFVELYQARAMKAATENPHAKATELLKVVTMKGNPRSLFVAVNDPEAFMGQNKTDGPDDLAQAPVMIAVEQAPQGAEKPEDKGKDRTTRIVVAGDSSWISNAILDTGTNVNEPLALNCISWMVGQERFSHEPVKEADYKLDMTKGLASLYTRLACPGMPFIALVVGVSVYLIRRR